MIEFKSITLEDKPIIDKLLEGNTYRASECCFSNLYGWSHKFNTQFAVWNDFLLIKFTRAAGECSYLAPFGKGDVKGDIDTLFSDCNCIDKFELSGVTENMWQKIDVVLPGVFQRISTSECYDYIYTSEKLIHLKGKKLQSKRNHINRFKKENREWKYISLNEQPEMLTGCKKMLEEWYKINLETSDNSLKYDFATTARFINDFQALGLRGGAIVVNDSIVAFSMGTRLSNDTFIVHVEKAFSEVQGAYAIINQQFVENEASQFTYINREDDMGLASLRKAKMSYHPDILLVKDSLKYTR